MKVELKDRNEKLMEGFVLPIFNSWRFDFNSVS